MFSGRIKIEAADLEAIFDVVNGSRYIFGIPENLSVISTEREGYVADTSIVIPREKLLAYFEARIDSWSVPPSNVACGTFQRNHF